MKSSHPRLVAALEAEQAAARAEAEAKDRPARRYKDFLWSTRDTGNSCGADS